MKFSVPLSKHFQELLLTPKHVVRLSLDDLDELSKLANNDHARQLFGDFSLEHALHTAWMVLGVRNKEKEIAGMMTVGTYPNIPSIPPWDWECCMQNLYGLTNVTSRNTLWIHLLLWDQRYYYFFLKPMVQYLYQKRNKLIYVIVIVPPTTCRTDFMSNLAVKVKPKGMEDLPRTQDLYIFSKETFMMDYKIRGAVEEDCTSIVDMIGLCAPELTEMYGSYYIRDLMTYSDNRKIVVAEDYYNCELRAVCVINKTVNYKLLAEEYELVPYNGLKKPDARDDDICIGNDYLMRRTTLKPFDFANVMMMNSGLAPRLSSFEQERELSFVNKLSIESSDNISLVFTADALYVYQDDDDDWSVQESVHTIFSDAEMTDSEMMLNNVLQDINAWNNEDLSNTSIHKDLNVDDSPEFHGEANAFAMEIAVCHPDHEAALLRLFETVFELCHDREYCILLLPCGEPTMDLCKYFSAVPHRTTSCMPYELYVMHRCSVFGRMNVDFIRREHMEQINALLSTVPNKMSLLVKIENYVINIGSPYTCLMLSCDNSIIGVAVLSEEQDVTFLRAHYDIYPVNFMSTKIDANGYLENFILSPIFQRHVKYFLREIHRISQFETLFYKIRPSDNLETTRETPLCNILDDLFPLKPLNQPEYNYRMLVTEGYMRRIPPIPNEDKEPFALYVSTVSTCAFQAITVNDRIVIVGPSHLAISFIVTLITGKWIKYRMKFTNITVIWEEGSSHFKLSTMIRETFLPTKYFVDAKYLDMINLKTYVNFIFGKITEINRKEQILIIGNDRYLPYDLLFLFTSEQFVLPLIYMENACPENVFTINNMSDVSIAIMKIKLLFNRKKFRNSKIIVYGHCLQALCILNGLINFGVPGKDIVFIEPFPYKMNLDLKHHHNVSVFNDVDVDAAVYKHISAEDIEIHSSYYFLNWDFDKDDEDTLITSASFESQHRLLKMRCVALFYLEDKQIPSRITSVCHNAGLVYDGRLVINNKYQTNDPNIYSAGSLTKYSRKYFAQNHLQKYYNSMEIGECLGNQIKEMFLPNELKEVEENLGWQFQRYERDGLVPKYRKPNMKYCRLPGGLYYLALTKPGMRVPLEVAIGKEDFGQIMISGNLHDLGSQGYFRLHLNSNNRVENVTCVTTSPVDVHNLNCIWGKHESLLNNLVLRFEMGHIKDLFEYFKQPWAYAIYHIKFYDVLDEMNRLMTSSMRDQGNSIVDEVIAKCVKNKWQPLPPEDLEELEQKFKTMSYPKILEQKLLKFIKSKLGIIPTVYAHPNVIRVLLENFSESPLFA